MVIDFPGLLPLIAMFKLNYGDCATLTEDDLATLNERQWLGDNVVSFYLEYLGQEVVPKSANVLFVSPATVQFVHLVSIEDGLSIDNLDLISPRLIVLPINNCEDPSVAQGGSHWSLLVYRAETGSFHHYDSMGGSNETHARTVAARMHKLIPKGKTSAGAAAGAAGAAAKGAPPWPFLTLWRLPSLTSRPSPPSLFSLFSVSSPWDLSRPVSYRNEKCARQANGESFNL